MQLFLAKRDNKLEKIKEISFENEREVQRLIEENLNEIFGFEFVKSEFTIEDLRIDTLAFDNETKSFVIIEYKRDRNFSVIDQGYAYLSLLLQNKAEIILKYNEAKNKNLKLDSVDFSQSKVIFISPQFTKFQRKAINFKDLPIELWEISKYEGDIISFNKLSSPDTSESITKISKNNEMIQKISREIKIYTEDDHLMKIPQNIQEVYNELKDRILNLGQNIEIRPKKHYIGFIANTNFVDVHLNKSGLKLWINLRKGELDDPKKVARDVSNIGHWGNGAYEVFLKPGSDLDYIMLLIKQAYKKHSN